MVYAISKFILWPVVSLFVKKIDGLDNLPQKPCILVCNHESYIDAVILIMMVAWYRNKQLCMFATKEKFLGPIWNMVFNHFGAIRVNGSMKKGVTALKQGKWVTIFPEAQRTYTGKVQPVKHTGLGVIALEGRAPVIPIGISSFRFWNRYHRCPRFTRTITVTIGKPMHFKGKATKPAIKKVITQVMKEVKKLARISHA